MNIAIRGRGARGETSLLAGPEGRALYIDGVFHEQGPWGAVFDVTDLERIEVLRGPAGHAVRGRNSTGGRGSTSTTKKPTGDLGAKVEGSVGNFRLPAPRAPASTCRARCPNVGPLSCRTTASRPDGWGRQPLRRPAAAAGPRGSRRISPSEGQTIPTASPCAGRRPRNLSVDYSYDNTDNEGVAGPPFPGGEGARQYLQLRRLADSVPLHFPRRARCTSRWRARRRGSRQAPGRLQPRRDRRVSGLEVDGPELHGRLGGLWTSSRSSTSSASARPIWLAIAATWDGGRLHRARSVSMGVFNGQTAPIQVPGFSRVGSPRVSIEMESPRIPADRQSLRRAPALHRRPVSTTRRRAEQGDDPQTFSLPIAFIAHPWASTRRGSGPVVRRGPGFLPRPHSAARFCVGLAAPADPAGWRGAIPYIARHDRLLLRPGTPSRGAGLRPDHLCRHRSVRLDARHTLHGRRERRVPLQPEHRRLLPRTTRSRPDDKWGQTSATRSTANYAFTDVLSVYLTYATGYNGGRPSNARASNVGPRFQTPFEEGGSRDLGTRP
jgi:hypothetical protein